MVLQYQHSSCTTTPEPFPYASLTSLDHKRYWLVTVLFRVCVMYIQGAGLPPSSPLNGSNAHPRALTAPDFRTSNPRAMCTLCVTNCSCCRDDIGDHDKWAAHFAAPRIIHATEVRPAIADIEVQLSGTGPWDLSGAPIAPDALDGGVRLIHVPGHTAGCIALWHAPSRAVFTGDHLGWSERVGGVSIFPRYNRGGIAKQVESVDALLELDFLHVLPGHGRRFSVAGEEERREMAAQVRRDFAGAPSAVA